MIPEDVIEQVKAAADIVAIIGESVPLKRTGSDWRGPCPFHGGTNRNFAVVPRKQLFHCFVCNEKGNVFSYLMKRFGMDYPSAVRDVARRSGIEVPDERARSGPDPNAPLLSAVSAAHEWFRAQLADAAGAEARRYLEGRGFGAAELGTYEFGLAPRGTAMLDEMARLGIGEDTLEAAGLAVRREEGGLVPRFRGRLIIPIHDLRGRLVAFGGRALGDFEPKYLNSPESAIFHKGRQLYRLHAARQGIRKAEFAILVEGYFDALRLELAGFDNVVAPLGTALTPEQAQLLRRYSGAVTVLYDSDAAGLRATFRAADELLRQGVRVRVATMPPGEDPDTLVAGGGAAALAPILDQAVDVLDRKLQLLAQRGWFDDLEHRRRALDRLLPTIRAASDPITQQLYLGKVADRMQISKQVLEGEMRLQASHYARPSGPAVPPPPAPRSATNDGFTGAESELLKVLLVSPPHAERAREELAPALFEDDAMRELFQGLVDGRLQPGGQLPPGLSHAAEAAWEALRASAEALRDGADLDAMYVGNAQMLLCRPEWRALEALDDPRERAARRKAFQERYPTQYRALHLQRAMRRP